jgi:nitrite reductase/ring-hydroxylating ferredoxin subunit
MSDWICVAKREELAEGAMIAVSAAGKRLIVYRTATGYFATDRRCTHQGADLIRGYFDQDIIECPVHQGRFCVRTGAPLSAPACIGLKTYPTRITDEAICVQIE